MTGPLIKKTSCEPLYHCAGSKRSPVKRVWLCFVQTGETKKARSACSYLFLPCSKYGVFKAHNKGVEGNQAQNEGWKDKGKLEKFLENKKPDFKSSFLFSKTHVYCEIE